MKNIKIKSINIILILILLIIFVPLRFDFSFIPNITKNASAEYGVLEIKEDTVWSSDTDLSEYEEVKIMWDATVMIEPGSHIKIRKLVLEDIGRIVAKGTIENPITFTKLPYEQSTQYDPKCFLDSEGDIQFNGYASNDYPSEPSIFKFVNFEGLGEYFDKSTLNCPSFTFNNFFIKNAYANNEEIIQIPAIQFNSGKAEMENVIFNNNKYTDIKVDIEPEEHQTETSYLHIKNSNFQNNEQNTAVLSTVGNYDYDAEDECYDGCYDSCDDNQLCIEICKQTCRDQNNDFFIPDNTKVVLQNNWYGSQFGPSTWNYQTQGVGERVIGTLTRDIDDYRGSPDFASSVIFLPGAKASKLYNGSNQVWPPTPNGDDYKDLLLDENGNSLEDIYTDEPISEVAAPSPFGINIYKSFLDDLRDLKEDRIIKNYALFAYDWREAVDDIAQTGTEYENGVTKNPVMQIENLAETSTSGKVTIVAHSNGGLLAKAIMQELENRNEQDLIDNIVLVSSPQIGTPKAILTMLYGYDEKMPIPGLITDAQAREVAENMPAAYGLLPAEEYFNRNQENLIKFNSQNTVYKKYKNVYGDDIGTYDEFRDFLLAKKDNRQKPDKDDIDKENILNEKLFDNNRQLQEKLNNWIPPQNVNLIQIGGWGLDTIKGVNYEDITKLQCKDEITKDGIKRSKCENVTLGTYVPQYTVDGDEIVVTSSSLMLSNSQNVERYWLDLYEQNKNEANRKHANILEVKQLRDLISNIITKHKAPNELPEYLSKTKPSYDNAINNSKHNTTRIRMSLYSPLDIHLYNKQGNHTGPAVDENGNKVIEENMPNSYYDTMGEHKYVGWGISSDVRVELTGYDTGSYTIKLAEVSATADGEKTNSYLTIKDLPTDKNTKVTFAIPETGLENITNLEADYDGDGNIDYIVTPQIGEEVTLDETQNQDDIISTEASSEVDEVKHSRENAWEQKSQSDDDDDDKKEKSDSTENTLNESSLRGGTTWQSLSNDEYLNNEANNNLQKDKTINSNDDTIKKQEINKTNKEQNDDILKYILITILILSILILSIFIFKKLIK